MLSHPNVEFSEKEGHRESHGRNPLLEPPHFPGIRVLSGQHLGTIEHVSDVAWWMSVRRRRVRDVRCLETASIATAEGWLLGFCRKCFFFLVLG
ncbi:hypothetical protein ES332_A03G166900v1 [Gossypium tomentosum]|uniref:Uncharacterized protein n=1 Tax=Gossypium tomentosum TaxID=34277 RepID=A0A5D2R7C5_GOSTO|nr:hypothetical protein ES332_A03G166900v1 [Gossypium tomentosum]